MARKQLSKSEIKEFLEQYPYANNFMTKKSNVVSEENLLLVNNQIKFFKHEEIWIPTLKLLNEKPELLPKVTIDQGAIKFIIKGADIMRPGITACETANKGEVVCVVDETHKKPIGIGKLIFSSEELLSMNSGKVVKSIHYVGDEIWKKS